MLIPPSIGNPSNEYINYWVDDHSLLHGNKPQHTLIIYNSRNHSKDPSKGSRFKRMIQSWDRVNSQFSSVQIPIGSILLIGELGSSHLYNGFIESPFECTETWAKLSQIVVIQRSFGRISLIQDWNKSWFVEIEKTLGDVGTSLKPKRALRFHMSPAACSNEGGWTFAMSCFFHPSGFLNRRDHKDDKVCF